MLSDHKMPHSRSTVCIIDDEPLCRSSLMDLFESMDINAEAFESGDEFLERWDLKSAGCILLDMQMPQMNGLDLQEQLTLAGSTLPIIFMSGQSDVPLSIKAFKAGATDFLLKPLRSDILISATNAAIEKDAELRLRAALFDDARRCAASLTPREREVMGFVCEGLMNKQIGFEMGISEIMVKLHRGRMMRKMEVRSVAELVRKFDLLA